MVVAQRMSEPDYIAFIESGIDGLWELHDGQLVEKPGMSWKHLNIISFLIGVIFRQIDLTEYRVLTESRLRRLTDTVFLPDIAVVPASYGDSIRDLPSLPIFAAPALLVVEVWSPTTGSYDVDTKVPGYQQRGDGEIWRIHPFERTLTRWIRQRDGRYAESVHRSGVITLDALPGVTIDLDLLFAV